MSALVRSPGALCVYVLVSAITPGPNNLMLLNVGLRRGRAAAAATAGGVAVGFGFQVVVFGLGVAAAIRAVPGLQAVVEVAGLAYLVWLAIALLGSRKLGETAPSHGFGGAVLYQWVNPKAYAMSLTTAGLFVAVGDRAAASALAVGVICAVICYPCTLLWGLGGSALASRLREESEVVRFNRIAAATLLATVLWLAVSLAVG